MSITTRGNLLDLRRTGVYAVNSNNGYKRPIPETVSNFRASVVITLEKLVST